MKRFIPQTIVLVTMVMLWVSVSLATPTCPENPDIQCVRHIAYDADANPLEQLTLFGYYYDDTPESGDLTFVQQYFLAVALKFTHQTLFEELGENGYSNPGYIDKEGIDTDCIIRLDTATLLCD